MQEREACMAGYSLCMLTEMMLFSMNFLCQYFFKANKVDQINLVKLRKETDLVVQKIW